jgi:hypothetical protein
MSYPSQQSDKSIRTHVEYTGTGVLLSQLEEESDAENLCSFFASKGVRANVGLLSRDGSFYVFLSELTLEFFRSLAQGANLELV